MYTLMQFYVSQWQTGELLALSVSMQCSSECWWRNIYKWSDGGGSSSISNALFGSPGVYLARCQGSLKNGQCEDCCYHISGTD